DDKDDDKDDNKDDDEDDERGDEEEEDEDLQLTGNGGASDGQLSGNEFHPSFDDRAGRRELDTPLGYKTPPGTKERPCAARYLHHREEEENDIAREYEDINELWNANDFDMEHVADTDKHEGEGAAAPRNVPRLERNSGGSHAGGVNTAQEYACSSVHRLPCNKDGVILDVQNPVPPANDPKPPNDWTPYSDCVQFETAYLLYRREQMSAGNINALLDLWAASLSPHGGAPPFRNSTDLYDTIDRTSLGSVRWKLFEITFPEHLRPSDAGEILTWMTTTYDVWYRDIRDIAHNILGNPEFTSLIDYGPLQRFNEAGD
ncbi:hypothetical protein OH77DRAFT_1526133, partial [Trametes cingulata]